MDHGILLLSDFVLCCNAVGRAQTLSVQFSSTAPFSKQATLTLRGTSRAKWERLWLRCEADWVFWSHEMKANMKELDIVRNYISDDEFWNFLDYRVVLLPFHFPHRRKFRWRKKSLTHFNNFHYLQELFLGLFLSLKSRNPLRMQWPVEEFQWSGTRVWMDGWMDVHKHAWKKVPCKLDSSHLCLLAEGG